VKRKLGCAVFAFIGFLWIGFVAFDMFVHVYGDCFDEKLCIAYKQAAQGLVLWRGFAVGLLLCIAYAIYRQFFEDEDVQ